MEYFVNLLPAPTMRAWHSSGDRKLSNTSSSGASL